MKRTTASKSILSSFAFLCLRCAWLPYQPTPRRKQRREL